ncbi:MAG: glutamyl-tRNA reductase [Phycisphaeraceae bacterium]|nr:glutamyl-tRNA reductase [Phycisphaeraceae bacterium]
MRIAMVGVSHRTAPVDIRERLSLNHERLDQALRELRNRFPHAECVIVCTCNRTELYVAHPATMPPGADDLRQFFVDLSGMAPSDLLAASVHRENDQAVGHLFRVASGLESMVLGEPQILGQVRRAYERARDQQCVGPVLHRVFQQALASAKEARTRTGIDAGRVSIGSVAVDFARQIFEDFTDKTVVAIGAGELAKLAMRHLTALHPAKLWIVNRTTERAMQLARTLGLCEANGGVRPMDQLDGLLIDADIVVTSTSSPTAVLTVARCKPLLRQRRHRPLFILDLAVPRDVEPQVAGLRNVYLYNIDDLQNVVARTHDHRGELAEAAQKLLAEQIRVCMTGIRHRDVGQLVRALRTKLHGLGDEECTRTLRKLEQARPEQWRELMEEHTQRLVNKILHMPLSQLDHRHADAPLGFYAAALRRLFQLEETDAGPVDDGGEDRGI